MGPSCADDMYFLLAFSPVRSFAGRGLLIGVWSPKYIRRAFPADFCIVAPALPGRPKRSWPWPRRIRPHRCAPGRPRRPTTPSRPPKNGGRAPSLNYQTIRLRRPSYRKATKIPAPIEIHAGRCSAAKTSGDIAPEYRPIAFNSLPPETGVGFLTSPAPFTAFLFFGYEYLRGSKRYAARDLARIAGA